MPQFFTAISYPKEAVHTIDGKEMVELRYLTQRVPVAKQAPQKTGGYGWTEKQNEILADLRRQKIPVTEIAKRLKKSPAAVYSRVAKMKK